MAQAQIQLTDGKKEFLVPVAVLNGHAFDDDPVITYMLLEMTPEERKAILPIYWKTLIRSALLNNAIITEANGWQAASVIILPGGCVDNAWTLFYAGFLTVLWRIGFHGLKRLWTEFSGMTDNAKRKGLRGQKHYYYIFSLGTEHMHRGKGLAKAIMRSHQERAKAENVPLWLEATSISSRNLYISLGFKEVEEIVLGRGKVAADASKQPNGPGVSVFAMVWWPPSSAMVEN